MLTFKVVALALIAGAFVVPAQAATWDTPEQMSIAMQIGSALGGAAFCSAEVDTNGLVAAIKDRIAPTGKLTPEMTAALMFYVVAMQAGHTPVSGVGRMNKRQLAEHCARMLASFGPNGSEVKGLIKP